VSKLTIGIDLGTTNSLVSVWQDGRSVLIPNSLGSFLTPSVVSVDQDGSFLVGQAAKERLQTHPSQTVASFKRYMGTRWVARLGSHAFRAEDLSALVLQSLKADVRAYLGESVPNAVITVPAYFSDVQRQATRAAGQIAGFANVTLLNEPTAAALAYGLHQNEDAVQFLVFDLGGGTFDVSVLEMFEGVMEVKATAGDNRLGGDDIDAALVDLFVEKTGFPLETDTGLLQIPRLKAVAELAKRQLSQADTYEMRLPLGDKAYGLDLTPAMLEAAAQSLLQRLRDPVERALRDASIHPRNLNAIVLAGGSTRMPLVRQLVTKMFGRFPETALNPDEVVAMGAAVQAGLKMKDVALAERVMTDVCPYTLGIATSKQLSNGQYVSGFMAPVLDRNTPIPTSKVQRFSPLQAEQHEIAIHVYQGESRKVEENVKLGEFMLPIPKAPLGEVSADVRFTYDVNGLLEVQATPLRLGVKSGEERALIIQNSDERLSEKEIAIRLERMRGLKIHPRDQLRHRTLLARAERIHSMLLGHQRDHLAAQIAEYEFALESQNDPAIEKAKRVLAVLLNQLDGDAPLDL
jgi:molecular chaperone HscC